MARRRPPIAARALAAALVIAATPAAALAQEDDGVSPLAARLALNSGWVTASFDLTNALPTEFRDRLKNGLSSKVVMQLKLLDASETAIAGTAHTRTCVFQFDIWDENLEVRLYDDEVLRRRVEHKRIDRGLEECGMVRDFRLADPGLLRRPAGYQLEVLLQLNPVTEEQYQRAREFKSNPRRSRRSRPRTFFGAVASLFGIKPDERDDEILFRSWPLRHPEPGRPR